MTLLANLSFLVATQNGERDLWTSSLLSFSRAYSRLSRTVLRWRILGIHRSLTFHKFKWIEKIGEARTYCLPLDSTQNRKIFSFRSLVFAHSFLIEPLDNCQPTRKDHHHSIDQSVLRKIFRLRQVNIARFVGLFAVMILRFAPSALSSSARPALLSWPCLFRPKSVSTRQSPPTRGRS